MSWGRAVQKLCNYKGGICAEHGCRQSRWASLYAFTPLDNPRGQYHGPFTSANREVKFMGENTVWPEVGLSRIGDILLDFESK